MTKCQNKVMKLSNWIPNPICKNINPVSIDCGGGEVFYNRM